MNNNGLTSIQAAQKLKECGMNTLEHKKKSKPLAVFAGQFKDFMVIILLAATVISFLLGEVYDAVTIILIVFLNAVLGFVQEFRTEKTLETLKDLSAPTAKCVRDRKVCEIGAEKLVPCDLIKLEAGDKVPADAVLVEERGLFADESVLTGESVPVRKCAVRNGIFDDDNSLNKKTVVYSGTHITRGNAYAVVVATGKNAQIGKISDMLGQIETSETPLQKRLGELGKIIGIICIAVCFIVFGAGVWRGEPIFEMLMTGITIAIAAIPEGLPATVTIALALAVRRMLKQRALVNRLHSVETLGCTTVICSDKTGTITENKMTVTEIFAGGTNYSITGNGHKIAGEVLRDGLRVNVKSQLALKSALECAVLCANASISGDTSTRDRGNLSSDGDFKVVGDPTETALLIAAAKANVKAEDLAAKYVKIDEIPFDSERKFMTVIVGKNGDNPQNSGQIAFTKGAADVILPKCAFIQKGGEVVEFSRDERAALIAKAEQLGAKALRVIALAKKDGAGNGGFTENMVFLGLAGMLDPPRAEAKEAIKLCAAAHIKTVMITGDHKNTAVAIAKQAGIPCNSKDAAITGAELDKLSDTELDRRLDGINVFARVNPSHKLRLVQAYKRKGNIVAMTGDGVNDAPAIKEADVGVSMGLAGTDVAKEAADIVLMDDNFATLVGAVEQGRAIYSNIRKFVRYLLSCNIGEVLTMFIGIMMGFPVVLLPVQILLVNLVTDGLPALALSMEPPERDVMRKAPRTAENGGKSFFSGGLMSRIIFRGIMIGLCTLGCFSTILRLGFSLETARTCALLTLVASQLFHVFECKSENGSIFTVKYFSNPQLLGAVLVSAAVIAAAIFIAPLQLVFSTVELSTKQILISIIFSIIIPLISSFGKRKNT